MPTALHAPKTAFVTGASSGIGKAAALALARAGYRVVGTSRKVDSGEVRDGIRMIACDVTSDASVVAQWPPRTPNSVASNCW